MDGHERYPPVPGPSRLAGQASRPCSHTCRLALCAPSWLAADRRLPAARDGDPADSGGPANQPTQDFWSGCELRLMSSRGRSLSMFVVQRAFSRVRRGYDPDEVEDVRLGPSPSASAPLTLLPTASICCTAASQRARPPTSSRRSQRAGERTRTTDRRMHAARRNGVGALRERAAAGAEFAARSR
jgi:hypothetical protein